MKETYLYIYQREIRGKLNQLTVEKINAIDAAAKMRADNKQTIIDEAATKNTKTELLEFLKGKGYTHAKSNFTLARLTKAFNLTRKLNDGQSKKNVMDKFLVFYDSKTLSEILPEKAAEIANISKAIADEEQKISSLKSIEGEKFDEAYRTAINDPWFNCESRKEICSRVNDIVDLSQKFLDDFVNLIAELNESGNRTYNYTEAVQRAEDLKREKKKDADFYQSQVDNGYVPAYGGSRKSSKRNKSKSNRLNRRTKSNSR